MLKGMLVARGKYMLMADADGATRFSDLETLEKTMAEIEREGRGVVVGSRSQYHPEMASESEKVRAPISNPSLLPSVGSDRLRSGHGTEIYLTLYFCSW